MRQRAAGNGGVAKDTVVRSMRTDEFGAVREVAVNAFGGDPSLGLLLDELRSSWAWEDEFSFVAEVDGDIVGQVLYTHAFVDAPTRIDDGIHASVDPHSGCRVHGVPAAELPAVDDGSAGLPRRLLASRRGRSSPQP